MGDRSKAPPGVVVLKISAVERGGRGCDFRPRPPSLFGNRLPNRSVKRPYRGRASRLLEFVPAVAVAVSLCSPLSCRDIGAENAFQLRATTLMRENQLNAAPRAGDGVLVQVLYRGSDAVSFGSCAPSEVFHRVPFVVRPVHNCSDSRGRRQPPWESFSENPFPS